MLNRASHMRVLALRSQCLARRPIHSQSLPVTRAITRPVARPQRKTAQIQQMRYRRQKSTWQSAKSLFRENPGSMTFWAIGMAFLLYMGVYVNVYYQTSIQPIVSTFPEEVHKKLLRALYYADHEKDEKLALRYFKEALLAADENGMDPLGEEILGVKIRMASFLEGIGKHQLAIKVLETARRECLTWEGKWGWKKEPEIRKKRSRLLGQAIAISIKIASLYGCPYVQDWDNAEQMLVWAVETQLKETQRRQTEGVLEGDGPWMTDEQQGGSFEALAHFYEAKEEYLLATPLFLRALTHCPTDTCHAVTLMNNIATSLAQQPPPDPELVAKNPSFTSFIDQAEKWCTKALTVCAKIPEKNRTPECLTASSVAKYNLASFAEFNGQLDEAEKLYQQAKVMAEEAPSEDSEVWDLEYGPRLKKSFGTKLWEWMVGPEPQSKRDMDRARRSIGSSLAFDPEKAKRVAEGDDDEDPKKPWGMMIGFTYYPFRETWERMFPRIDDKERGFQRGFKEGVSKADEGIRRIEKARLAKSQKDS